MDVTADGERLLLVSVNAASELSLVVCELPACTNRRDFDAPPDLRPPVQWTPDDQAIAYVDTTRANIWSLPLDGSPPLKITHFTETVPGRAIADYAWSRDGQHLAIVRATTTEDIVLLSGL